MRYCRVQKFVIQFSMCRTKWTETRCGSTGLWRARRTRSRVRHTSRITIRNKRPLSVVCASPPLIHEGSADFNLDCTASGAPLRPILAYSYVWAASGLTTDLSRLSGTSGPTPTFAVPADVNVRRDVRVHGLRYRAAVECRKTARRTAITDSTVVDGNGPEH